MLPQLSLDNQLCFRLYAASRLITKAYHPFLSKIGLTYPQYLVMMVLWEKDCQRVNDIAKRLYLETNTATPLLKRMEADGLVKRDKGKGDGRQIIVSLTEKGKELEKKAAAVPECVSAVAACPSVSPATIPSIFSTLDDLVATLASREAQD